ncbi:hypothetical protein MBLNU13_g06411t1 [Cladosporium sp. NU13]
MSQRNENDAEIGKQRRKAQNRHNQRAHRLRTKKQSTNSPGKLHVFEITRWRLDDFHYTQDKITSHRASCAKYAAPTTALTDEAAEVIELPQCQDQVELTTPAIIFPLSTDHLLHLIQYNVFRAFVTNKRILNLLLTGWTEALPSRASCPIDGPYRDDTNVFPLNPNIPAALVPSVFKQAHPHPTWINFIPFPRIRDHLIRCQRSFDHWDFLQDLIGELMGTNQFPNRQSMPTTFNVTDPEPRDRDDITRGRKGFIVWGDPHIMHNWEATPGFLTKWAWAYYLTEIHHAERGSQVSSHL